MSISRLYNALAHIATSDFTDIVIGAKVLFLPTGDPHKLRLDMADGSLMDVHLTANGRYSYHWDRQMTMYGDIYRHDNAPHLRWKHISTFPKHFHNGNESHVVESTISDNPEQAIREILLFVQQKLLSG